VGIGARAVIRFALVILLQPLILFGAANEIDWPMGWMYLGLFIFLSLGSRLLVRIKNTSLIAERARSLDRSDVPLMDKILVGVIAIFGPIVVLLVSGLDHRFGWTSSLPAYIPWLTLAFATAGLALGTWAMLENPFFSAVARIQKDRRQSVVSTGPYGFVRHPSYLGGIITFLCIPSS
jgi:protein-S-isoprenylcysteine O-methyltransferase Ste14